MKIKSIILTLLIPLVGCSDLEVENQAPTPNGESCTNVDYSVSLATVQALVTAQEKATRGTSESEGKVSCVVDEENDTLLYVYNHPEGGWTVYSSDSRVPSIVAESEKGSYEEAMQNDGVAEWMGNIAIDMKMIKQAENSQLKFTKEEIDNNIRYWDLVSRPEKVIDSTIRTKSAIGLQPNIPTPGHFELFGSTEREVVTFELGHLIETHWHQHDPYNRYCPLKTDGSGERAPAGCVAIAGAQMVNYLHYKLGCPQNAPSVVTCTGNINNYQFRVIGLSSSIWNLMRTDHSKAAPLIALVAMSVNTDFGNNGSGADTEDLVRKVFNPIGISCEWEDYNSQDVINSLNNQMPVIIRARRNLTSGHAFIIDDYRRFQTKRTTTYHWVPDVEPDEDGRYPLIRLPEVTSYDVVTYTNPREEIRMNWGWEDQSNDNTYFSPTDDWIVTPSQHNYHRSRKMIINFRTN